MESGRWGEEMGEVVGERWGECLGDWWVGIGDKRRTVVVEEGGGSEGSSWDAWSEDVV